MRVCLCSAQACSNPVCVACGGPCREVLVTCDGTAWCGVVLLQSTCACRFPNFEKVRFFRVKHAAFVQYRDVPSAAFALQNMKVGRTVVLSRTNQQSCLCCCECGGLGRAMRLLHAHTLHTRTHTLSLSLSLSFSLSLPHTHTHTESLLACLTFGCCSQNYKFSDGALLNLNFANQ